MSKLDGLSPGDDQGAIAMVVEARELEMAVYAEASRLRSAEGLGPVQAMHRAAAALVPRHWVYSIVVAYGGMVKFFITYYQGA